MRPFGHDRGLEAVCALLRLADFFGFSAFFAFSAFFGFTTFAAFGVADLPALVFFGFWVLTFLAALTFLGSSAFAPGKAAFCFHFWAFQPLLMCACWAVGASGCDSSRVYALRASFRVIQDRSSASSPPGVASLIEPAYPSSPVGSPPRRQNVPGNRRRNRITVKLNHRK